MTETREYYTLSETELQHLPGRILAALIEAHASRSRITSATLASRLHSNDRKIRAAITHLIHRGYIILSSVRPPFGYYLASSKSETEEYVATQMSRIANDHERVRAIQQSAARAWSDFKQTPLNWD
jgi:hypothetical protein